MFHTSILGSVEKNIIRRNSSRVIRNENKKHGEKKTVELRVKYEIIETFKDRCKCSIGFFLFKMANQ